MSTAILFKCPECKTIGHAKPEWLGKNAKCPKCGHVSRIAAAEQTPPAADETAPAPAPPAPETMPDLKMSPPHPRWEYRVVRHEPALVGDLAQKLTDDMNHAGAEGWECLSILQQFGVFLVYKRPKE